MAIEKRIGAYSAYAIAVENGFTGTEKEWLESLIGPRGYQGWGVSAVSVSADGSLIFTIKNPETGETRELEPIQIETLNALNSISTAKDEAVNEVKKAQTQATEAVGTAKTQAVQAVEDAENTGVSAVEDAKSNALTEVGKAKTTAVDAVNAAGTQAASDAQTAITAAKNQAVSDVQNAGQSAVEKVQEAQTSAEQAVDTAKNSAVQAVENAGTAEIEKINDILPVPTEADNGKVPVVQTNGKYVLKQQIDDTKTALDTTWSSENIVSKFCTPFEVSGSIVICNPIEGSQLNMLAQIEPVQQGEGTPSTENVRPIHGWDSVTICRGGKNLWGGRLFKAQYMSGIPYITEYEDITFPYNPAYATDGLAVILPVSAYQTFTFKAHEANENATYRYAIYVDFESAYNYKNKLESKTMLSNTSFTVSSSGIMVFMIGGTWTSDNDKIHVFTEEEKFQLELGDTSTAYESYRGETFTIPTSEMVYGGTLDVGSGVLTKTHQNIPSYAGEDVGDEWISSTGSLTDGAQVVYQLPQPEIIQLDLQEIYALSGINTICVDSGNVTVSGYSDPKTVINTLTKRIAALEQNAIGGRYL